jgi:hypothetical protein
MTRIYEFPSFKLSKQLFFVPGSSFDGGLTSGGARISLPEPGGFSALDLQPSLQVNEWDFPLSSWIMSKGNGQVFRVRLAPTPQVCMARKPNVPWGAETIYPDSPWSNLQNWSNDFILRYAVAAQEGDNTLVINMSSVGRVLQIGHVIGHKNNTYLVDNIVYDDAHVATITVIPPIRQTVSVNDTAYFRPYFTGVITNADEFRATYDAVNTGNIQVGVIKLREANVYE